MLELNGKVGVVTGAGSGIGRAVASRFAAEGMNVVLADIEEPALDSAVAEITAAGGDVIGVKTDVSDAAQIENLASKAIDAFGKVNIVHNNAGVVTAGPLEDLTDDDWNWTLGVDLWSVIYGIRTFLPLIKEAGEGHIVNTASIAGIQAAPGIAPYNVAKFGVVALSETLAYELLPFENINASVLCPGAVNTKIVQSGRNRPATMADHKQTAVDDSFTSNNANMLQATGLDPADVASMVVDAMQTKRFWIITHDEWYQIMIDRAAAMAKDGSLRMGTPPS